MGWKSKNRHSIYICHFLWADSSFSLAWFRILTDLLQLVTLAIDYLNCWLCDVPALCCLCLSQCICVLCYIQCALCVSQPVCCMPCFVCLNLCAVHHVLCVSQPVCCTLCFVCLLACVLYSMFCVSQPVCCTPCFCVSQPMHLCAPRVQPGQVQHASVSGAVLSPLSKYSWSSYFLLSLLFPPFDSAEKKSLLTFWFFCACTLNDDGHVLAFLKKATKTRRSCVRR